MLSEIFYWLFNMSIAAALIGAIVVLLRSVRKIPRRISVVLWLAPFLRMCVPFGLNYPYSLMSLLSKITTKTVTVYQPAEGISFSMTNFVMSAEKYFPITYKVNLLGDVFTAAAIIWAVVFLAIVLTLSIIYFTTLHEMKDAVHGEGNVYYSDKIISPAVYGIIRPRIVLPVCYRDKDSGYALLHERAHIKRADNLWRIIAFAITAVHWFNPFAWLFLRLFLSDLELACDEQVISGLKADQIKQYAHSLLDSRASASLFVSAFGSAAIRTRIESILSFKKMTWISLVGFIALAAAILAVLLTNAA